MKREYISTGKTIEDAIAAGCAALGVERDSVSVEVLEAPSRGFLGLGATEGKVLLTWEQTAETKAIDFLTEVFGHMDFEVNIESQLTDDALGLTLEGPDMGIIIGRRGETLDALQYITSLVVNKDEDDYVRVTLDTENYRGKRQETLARLARKLASKVVKYRHNVTLEPMNPYERRIIHATLQDFRGVTTYSTGTGQNRRVVIAYAPNGAPSRTTRAD